MESKRKIVNGETVCECELSVDELEMIYSALNRNFCRLDQKRIEASSPYAKEFFGEKCAKVDRLIDKVHDLLIMTTRAACPLPGSL